MSAKQITIAIQQLAEMQLVLKNLAKGTLRVAECGDNVLQHAFNSIDSANHSLKVLSERDQLKITDHDKYLQETASTLFLGFATKYFANM